MSEEHKTYKLKKDLPNVKAGTLFRWSSFFELYICEQGPYDVEPDKHPDWFEVYTEKGKKDLKRISHADIVKKSSTQSGQRELLRELANRYNTLIDYIKKEGE